GVEVTPLFGPIGDAAWQAVEGGDFQADLLLVVTVFGSLPDFGTLTRVHQMPERRNRSVVKIRSRRPNAIQGRSDITPRITDRRRLAIIVEPTQAVMLTTRNF